MSQLESTRASATAVSRNSDEASVEIFRSYLRIPSIHPDVNYDDCVTFLQEQAKSLDLPVKVYEVHPKKPIVVITWVGTEPSQSSILLNSHMDVVPVFPEKWTHPPFSAYMDENGDIYARGAQDMKCVGIEYLEAIRRLKSDGVKLKRTIHVSFVPDEEIGGTLGMKIFINTNDFKALNVGFALDEGVVCPEPDIYYMFSGERAIWHVHVKCPGSAGHGSLLIGNTAGEKLRVIVEKFYELRNKEKEKLKDPKVKIGDVMTINMTQVYGGIQSNVIPDELTAVFDVRIPPTIDHIELEKMFNSWCKEAGEGVHLDFEKKDPNIESTRTDDSNPFWLAFKKSCDDQGLKLDTGTFPGGTDCRYVRQVGIPALGFTPANNTPILLHDHDERLNKHVFLQGIKVYMKIIPAVANV